MNALSKDNIYFTYTPAKSLNSQHQCVIQLFNWEGGLGEKGRGK
jgi:hypothetical protein